MTGRRPGPAPQIQGFTYLSHLGSGGFADVFLYEQRRPSRRVAVKVLLADRLDDGALARFDAEADLMALLSTHPNIVTIYQADLTDDGRPYLVMEYCPRPNLGVRYKREVLGVTEALHTGIQVAGAVESVHRANILHRDIKPANVLVTEYNRPVLTDFGISVVTGETAGAQGLSIPWSPPESLSDASTSGTAADVYALGATVYTLLAGRSPFEIPGGDNSALALVSRVESVPVPRLGRADVPASLEQVLATSMAKQPGSRYSSALAFARALQQVQVELALSMTPVEIREDAAPEAAHQEEDDDPGTRIRSITSIDPSPQLPSAWETADAARPGASTSASPQERTAPPTSAPTSGVRDAGGAPPGSARHGSALPATAPAAPPSRPVFATAGASQVRAPAAPAAGRPAGGVLEADTVLRVPVAQPPAATPAEPETPPRRGRTVAMVAAAVLVLGGAAAGTWAALREADAPETPADTATSAAPVDALGDLVPAPADLTGTPVDDALEFSWTNPDPREGDAYLWRPVAVGQEAPFAATDATTVTVPLEGEGEVCIEVVLRRANGQASPPVTGCTGP